MNWHNRNAFKHGLSRSTVGRPNTFEIEELARAIVGSSPSPVRAAAGRELAAAEVEYRNLEKYRLALINAESVIALKASASGPCYNEAWQPVGDCDSILRVIQLLAKLER